MNRGASRAIGILALKDRLHSRPNPVIVLSGDPGYAVTVRQYKSRRSALIRALVTALLLIGQGQVCEAQPKSGQQESPADSEALSRFLPSNATLVMQLSVHFAGKGSPEMVLAYASESDESVTTGVRVVSGGSVSFEESADVNNGAGGRDAIKIEKVKARNGAEGVVVSLKSSGAGAATEWHVLGMVNGKISRLEPRRARANVLKRRGYQDSGYNAVTAHGEYIVETQPGYSRATARCCPDRPTIEMTFRFTGTALRVDKVSSLPFSPNKY